MSKPTNRVLALALVPLFCGCAVPAFAGGELAQRRDMSPLDRAKVLNVESKRWLGYGSTGQTTSTTMVPSTVGARVCTTNVGVPANTAPVGQYGPQQNAYGPQSRKDNIVVVSGDIISLCK
ncbi:hypothetical protein [Dokdonella soli]|uniref:DUF4156 domain-containing protein n=1 Tax=Dokdonella soli TaxID=529810 RepID=A0ABN1IZV2_9GAMM